MFATCILFATFCSMGTLVRRKKTWCYCARKVMEFSQLMADILAYVSCKFEMYTFEIAKVIGENVPIAFLYVLSILAIGPGSSSGRNFRIIIFILIEIHRTQLCKKL